MDRGKVVDPSTTEKQEGTGDTGVRDEAKGSEQGENLPAAGGSETPEGSDEGPLRFTGLAASKVQEALSAENIPNSVLRVQVSGQGCCGYSYALGIDNEQDGDLRFASGGVEYIVDPVSRLLLEGTTIDYVETDAGEGFKFDNPNDTPPSCGSTGCGGCCPH